MEFVPPPLRDQFVVHLRFAFPGNREDGDDLLAPMRAVSTPLMDTVGPMDYLDIDQVHMDPVDPLPFTEGGVLLKDFEEEAVASLLELAGEGSGCPLIMIEIRPLGGALAKGRGLADAVSGRDAAFLLFLVGLNAPPAAEASIASTRAILAAMVPHSTGFTLVNFHGTPGDEADRARAWSPAVYERMRAAKANYDPGNILRFGHAITAVASGS
jgi:hypothetical protein